MSEDDAGERAQELTLDGNAVAGMLQEFFGGEMTKSSGECAHCGQVNELGRVLAFTQAPGMVLRCPACGEILLRLVKTPHDMYVDARGVVYLRRAAARAGAR